MHHQLHVRALSGGVLALVAAITLPLVVGAQTNQWQPQIAIVWPHDTGGNQTSVVSSQLVNVSAWPQNVASCTLGPDPAIALWSGIDNNPAANTGVNPQLIQRMADGTQFVSEEFNNLLADLSNNPSSKFRFIAYSGSVPSSNVWIHAADPRTIFPNQFLPSGFADPAANAFDTRIQIVFPHDEAGNLATVNTATRVNLALDIFEHGTANSVAVGANFVPQLHYSVTNGSVQKGPVTNSLITYTVGSNTYPRWVLNNFPVNPGEQYHFTFLLAPTGQTGPVNPSIWTHAAQAQTILPNPVPPPSCFPGPLPSLTPSLTPILTNTLTPATGTPPPPTNTPLAATLTAQAPATQTAAASITPAPTP